MGSIQLISCTLLPGSKLMIVAPLKIDVKKKQIMTSMLRCKKATQRMVDRDCFRHLHAISSAGGFRLGIRLKKLVLLFENRLSPELYEIYWGSWTDLGVYRCPLHLFSRPAICLLANRSTDEGVDPSAQVPSDCFLCGCLVFWRRRLSRLVSILSSSLRARCLGTMPPVSGCFREPLQTQLGDSGLLNSDHALLWCDCRWGFCLLFLLNFVLPFEAIICFGDLMLLELDSNSFEGVFQLD
ncbi:hypothetical protein Fmac_001532 [Flemingia macrophylla]|uniref:Uncharacterized protein n=1 Tax=Flemingia macrophylla TaxID=520843 RepID=A0ABD1NHC3_9FABA